MTLSCPIKTLMIFGSMNKIEGSEFTKLMDEDF
jgi:hypothetical protein